MSDAKESSNNSSISILAILLLILSATGTLIEPLVSPRPDESDLHNAKSIKKNQVNETRLWQDPIDLLNNQIANDSWNTCIHTNTLKEDLKEFYRYKNFSVVAISVSGSLYDEITETRRRNRFAVVSAFNSKEYHPGNGEKLDYYKLKSAESDSCDKKDARDFIPYEWFDRDEDKTSSVLVLWIDESRAKYSSDNYRNFIERLIKEIRNDWQEVLKENDRTFFISEQYFDFKWIGPSGTALLVELLKSEPINYPNFKIFAHSATTPAKKIIRALQADCLDGSKDWYCAIKSNELDQESERIEKELNNALADRKIIRSIGTDDKLATALLWELWHRGINNSESIFSFFKPENKPGCNDGLVLITELDTLYARSLANYLQTDKFWAHCDRLNKPPIKSFAYLRGVDGKQPRNFNKDSESQNKKDNNKADSINSLMQWDDAPPEHAEGRNQYDYLRRLTDTISELEHNKQFAANGVKAIGILGSDVYDKLIILHALRERFKDVIFFTTDLDARYLHADQLRWTRNLIVASNFDLTLHSDWQVKSMPFRDGYQTSMYYSVLMALRELDAGKKNNTLTLVEPTKLLHPQIFEIGRTRAVHLDSPSVSYLTKWVDCLNPFKIERKDTGLICSSNYVSQNKRLIQDSQIEPDRTSQKYPRIVIFENTVLLSSAAILILIIYHQVLQWMGWDTKKQFSFEDFKKIWEDKRILICSLLLILLILLLISKFIGEDVYEPFVWSEGISVWPNLVLRLFGISLILIFTWHFYRKLHACKNEIDTSFFAPGNEARYDRDEPGKEEKTICESWKDYVYKTNSIRMKWGITFVTLIAVVMTFLFLFEGNFKSLGTLNFPYRGDFSYGMHKILLFLQFLLLWGLVFWIAFEVMACNEFIKKIPAASTEVNNYKCWSSEIVTKIEDETGVSQEYLYRYLQFQIVVKITACISRLIYLPLGMILTILIGRSKIFDQFGIPLSLIIVFGIAVIYLLITIYRLRQTAENLRSIYLESYESQQVVVKKTSKHKGDEIQIERLLGLIRNEHKGIYAKFGNQPAFAALLLPFGGMSGVQILEYLFNI